MSNRKPECVFVTTVCGRCGESVEIQFSKRDVKQMLRGFNMPITKAQMLGEQYLLKHQKES